MQVVDLKRSNTKAGPTVRIAAQLEENADLHNDSDGKPITTCRRVYDATYTVVQAKDGVWRLTNTNVVERSTTDGSAVKK